MLMILRPTPRPRRPAGRILPVDGAPCMGSPLAYRTLAMVGLRAGCTDVGQGMRRLVIMGVSCVRPGLIGWLLCGGNGLRRRPWQPEMDDSSSGAPAGFRGGGRGRGRFRSPLLSSAHDLRPG